MKRITSLFAYLLAAILISPGTAISEDLKPVFIVGATAKSAPEIINQALSQGRRVTGLARSPERIGINHPNFTPMKGDVFDVASLASALRCDEVVISLIGPAFVPGKEVTSVDLYSVGTASLITAMRRKGNTWLIVTSSGGVEMIPAGKPTTEGFSENFVWMKRGQYQDMQRMERIVANSDLEYIILRPRGFRAGPKKDNLLISYGIPTPNPSSILSYTDFAALVLSLADGDQHLNRAIGVYTNEFASAP